MGISIDFSEISAILLPFGNNVIFVADLEIIFTEREYYGKD